VFRVRSVADPIKQMKMACYCYDASSLPQHTNPDFSFLNKFFYLYFSSLLFLLFLLINREMLGAPSIIVGAPSMLC